MKDPRDPERDLLVFFVAVVAIVAFLVWQWSLAMSGGVDQSCNRDGSCDSSALVCAPFGLYHRCKPKSLICKDSALPDATTPTATVVDPVTH